MPGTGKEEPPSLDYACRLLSRRDHSERELAVKLKKRGYGEEEAAAALRELKERGLLDDGRYARKWLDYYRDEKPMGRNRIVGELAKRGVAIGLARELVAREYPREEETALLFQLALKQVRKVRPENRGEAFARIGPFLSRRGFGGEDTAFALEMALDTEGLPAD